jgi:hypothetical protein
MCYCVIIVIAYQLKFVILHTQYNNRVLLYL